MEKRKGYYIHYDARTIVGVSKKIDMQLKEMLKIAEVEEICVSLKSKSYILNALAVLPFRSLLWDYSKAYDTIDLVDFIYFREISCDYKAIKFLRWVKKNNPSCKIIVEIPTYPKTKESFQSIQGIVLYPKEVWNRRIIKKYIDRYVVYSNHLKVYGVETIRTLNGIDVDSIRLVNHKLSSDRITLIAVAFMQRYHGYDRIIKGLAEYYAKGNSRGIVIKLVGDGPEVDHYKEIVAKYGLADHVEFFGNRVGQELDLLYDSADMAVASLGGYRIGINLFSSLKTREYLAKGLPIVCGAPIDVLINQGEDYCIEFPNDDTSIDIEKVVDFYDRIYKDNTRQQVAENIRKFAKENVDMNVVMKPIMDYIES